MPSIRGAISYAPADYLGALREAHRSQRLRPRRLPSPSRALTLFVIISAAHGSDVAIGQCAAKSVAVCTVACRRGRRRLRAWPARSPRWRRDARDGLQDWNPRVSRSVAGEKRAGRIYRQKSASNLFTRSDVTNKLVSWAGRPGPNGRRAAYRYARTLVARWKNTRDGKRVWMLVCRIGRKKNGRASDRSLPRNSLASVYLLIHARVPLSRALEPIHSQAVVTSNDALSFRVH